MKKIVSFSTIALGLICFSAQCYSQKTVIPHPVPQEFSSTQYVVEVNGTPVQVFQASPRVFFASFDFTGKANVKVTGSRIYIEWPPGVPRKEEPRFVWEGDVVVRPLSRNVMVKSDATTATFTLVEPGQYSVEGSITNRFDNDNNNVVLFLFANKPETERPKEGDPNVIYLKPGIHHQNIDLKSGQTLYLEAGAVLFGGINIFNARNVKILGRGVVFYYGPQSENHDNGNWHRKNWHPLTTNNCKGLTISGVTFVARSRTHTTNIYSTSDADFDNVKLLGVPNTNVNGDGFHFYMGCERVRITNSLVRSADDAFGFSEIGPQGYGKPAIDFSYWTDVGGEKSGWRDRGNRDIKDVRIENCVISVTRANIYRVSSREEGFKVDNIAMINCDIIHVPLGYLEVPRSLIRGGSGSVEASNFLFENIRFEEPAALLGLAIEASIYRNIIFKNITMKGEPIPSVVRSTVDGLVFDNVILNGKLITAIEDVPFEVITKEIKNLKFVKSK